MIFTAEQVTELLNILEYHHLFVFSTNFGVDILSDADKSLLKSFGVDIAKISKETPLYEKMFLFGRLSGLLRDEQVSTIDYNNFLLFVKSGQYIPLNKREKFELEIAKRKTYTHLKGLKEKAKGEFESIIIGEEQRRRQEYETAIQEETEKGVADRKSTQKIVSELGHRMGNWLHDWNRITQTEMNNIFQQGRAEVFREIGGEDTLVYKSVYPGACRHCIRLYLTRGIGSKPIVFKLSDLIKNGTNIGRKVIDWLATLTGIHAFCRCHLIRVPKGYVWSEEKQKFVMPENIERKVIRTSKIRISIGKLSFEV
jgi:hypothetical protein